MPGLDYSNERISAASQLAVSQLAALQQPATAAVRLRLPATAVAARRVAAVAPAVVATVRQWQPMVAAVVVRRW